MKALAGKSAIVTGAGRGIGRAIAIGLAEAGANVAINDIGPQESVEEVAEICRQQGVRARVAIADVGVQSDVEQIVAETADEFGSLDVAVSNAAYSDRELFHKADMPGFEKTIQVTMWGPYYLFRAAANRMIEQGDGGSMVLVSSLHSYQPIPGSTAYNMSKAATEQLAKTAATELCQHRIRVNMVRPGWVDTPGERKFFSEEKLQVNGSALPWGRLGKPEEVARAVTYLCDPASEYINGTALEVTGGIQLPTDQMHRLEKPGGQA